jgi:hypothetical protein
MTGFATGGLEISRATVGTLEDMGYEVDYCGADVFPVSKLGSSCVCSSIQAEGCGDSTITPPDDSSGKLSDAGRLTASEFGRQYLKNRSIEREESGADEDDGIIYLADKYVVIVYVEEGAIYEVHVTSDDLS